MIEFLYECFNWANLPATVLLLVVLSYWILVIVGVLGLDAIDLDLDLDLDVDADVDFDLDMEGGFDGDVNGGLFHSFAELMYLGDVPVVIVGSFFAVFLWIVTVLSNHYLNADFSLAVTLLWAIPNVIVSLIATRFAVMPFSTMFKNYDKTDDRREHMIGQLGVVKTSRVDEKFGQVEIAQDGPPLVINARTSKGVVLGQGDAARIVSYNQETGTYLVELSKWENN